MAPPTHILAIALLISYYTPTILVLAEQTYSKDCRPIRCSDDGPIVRFPFRLDTHAPHCGYDTLVLSCSGGNTVLSLPFSGDYNVTSIDYKNSMLEITRHSWTPYCPWSQIAEPNVTSPLFIIPSSIYVSWFDCSDVLTSFSEDEYLAGPISCLRSVGHFIYVASAYTDAAVIPSTCTRNRNSTLFVYDASSTFEDQHRIRDFVARPVVVLY